MGYYFGHKEYVDGYLVGYYYTRLLEYYRENHNDLDEKNDYKGQRLNELFPNIPKELIEQLLSLEEIQSKEKFNDKEYALFNQYKWYFEKLPMHKEIEHLAEKSWEKRCKILEYKELLEYIREHLIQEIDYKKEKLVVIEEIHNCRFNDLYINEDSTTEKRIKAVNKVLEDSCNLAGMECSEEIAKKIYNEETEEFRLYRINNIILYVKSIDEYAIYRIENYNLNKLWMLSSDKQGRENICLVKCNRYNQIVGI